MRIYVASRVKHAERWKHLRSLGYGIISTWIDEVDEGQTLDFTYLWKRITHEIMHSDRLVFYAEPEDFPFKGALVEVGMAIATGIPVFVYLSSTQLEGRTDRPVGSWIRHPKVRIVQSLYEALR
jgi:hypothetical protein